MSLKNLTIFTKNIAKIKMNEYYHYIILFFVRTLLILRSNIVDVASLQFIYIIY